MLIYFLTIEYTARILTSTLRNREPSLLQSAGGGARRAEETPKSRPTFIRKTKVEEKAKVDEEVDGRYWEEDRLLPSTIGLLTPPYCRNYNVIDSIVIIDSLSCPSRRAHRGPRSRRHTSPKWQESTGSPKEYARCCSSRAYSSSSSTSLNSYTCVTSPSWCYNVALLIPWVADCASSPRRSSSRCLLKASL